jgi:hypothetical protein
MKWIVGTVKKQKGIQTAKNICGLPLSRNVTIMSKATTVSAKKRVIAITAKLDRLASMSIVERRILSIESQMIPG